MGFTSWVFLMVGIGVGLITRPQLSRLLERPQSGQPEQVEIHRSDVEASRPDVVIHQAVQEALLAYYLSAEMSQFRAGFLARTSHELRSPLSSIISLHQLILTDLCEDHDEERDCINQAYGATQKLLALLDSLILVSKTEYGSAQQSLQSVQLATVLDEAYALTNLLAKNRNLRLSVDAVDPEIWVQADPRRLQQVLVMLIDMPIMLMEEGTIHVSIHPQPDKQQVEIWIDDYRPSSAWREPLDFMNASPPPERLMHQILQGIRNQTPLPLSPSRFQPGSPRLPVSVGMALMMCQILLDRMNGRLELLETPSANSAQTSNLESAGRSRLACYLPMDMDIS
ncbi:MAG TPA: HAMP domain-containing sensor histidine kinase [Candidatus Obscuribacterales bacterium]